MRPTRWPVLVAVAVVAGGAAYLITGPTYADVPSPRGFTLVWVALLAVAEVWMAAVTRARLSGRPGTRPIDPIQVARFAAFAKASSLVGAVIAGGYSGFLAWVAQRDTPTSHTDTRSAALGLSFGVLLVVAALVLEHVCRVKDDDDDDQPPGQR